MMIGVLLDAGGAGIGGICVASADDAAATETAAAGGIDAAATLGASGGGTEATDGGGSARGALGGASGRDPVIVALAAGTAGDTVVGATDGGGGVNSTPQCTQNFAVGWFSLPQAAHFIDSFLLGIRASGFRARHAVFRIRAAARSEERRIMDRSSLGCHRANAAVQRPSRRPRLNATIAPAGAGRIARRARLAALGSTASLIVEPAPLFDRAVSSAIDELAAQSPTSRRLDARRCSRRCALTRAAHR